MTDLELDLHQRMFDESVRIAGIWPFPQHEPAAPYLAAFEWRDESKQGVPKQISALYERWDADDISALFEGDGLNASDAHSELAGCAYRADVCGYIGVAEVPVFKGYDDSDAVSFSWGHYCTYLFFANSAEGIIEQACDKASADQKAAIEAAKVAS